MLNQTSLDWCVSNSKILIGSHVLFDTQKDQVEKRMILVRAQ